MKSSPFSTFGLSAGLFLSLSITACSTLAPTTQQTPSELDQLLFGSANELANIDERPVVDNRAFIERTQQMPRN